MSGRRARPTTQAPAQLLPGAASPDGRAAGSSPPRTRAPPRRAAAKAAAAAIAAGADADGAKLLGAGRKRSGSKPSVPLTGEAAAAEAAEAAEAAAAARTAAAAPAAPAPPAAAAKTTRARARPPRTSNARRGDAPALAPGAQQPTQEEAAAPAAEAAGAAHQAAAAPPSPSPSPSPAAAKRKAGGEGVRSPARRRTAGGAGVEVLDAAAAAALRGQPLMDLGELLPAVMVRRPSASVKTPYVADVKPLPPPGSAAATGTSAAATGGELLLAHAPALDCAGMVAPGCRVLLSTNAQRGPGQPATATSHAIQVVEDQRPNGGVALVGSHPLMAERLAAEVLRRRALVEGEGLGAGAEAAARASGDGAVGPGGVLKEGAEAIVGAGAAATTGPAAGGSRLPALAPYHRVETQRTFGATRVDFVLHNDDGSRTLLEVKNVVCADFPEGGVPPGRPAVGVYTAPALGYRPTALFPHGAAKPKIKVVSDRAIKHVHELTQLQLAGADEAGPLSCAVLFVVNRSDCVAFRPCHEADPLFAQVLKAAHEAGVKLLAVDVEWVGGRALLGKQLPVVFGPSVTSEVDAAWLQAVLHFNATDPRKNWKSAKRKAEQQDE